MQRLTPKQVIQETTAQYGILWEAGKDQIVPHEVYGNHSFLNVSKGWKFAFGEGCVGRSYARHETIVVEDEVSGNNIFLRKGDAEKCGINTIVFVPQESGSVLEVGFEQKLEQLPKSWWMNSILDMCSSSAQADDFEMQSVHRIRTPSPVCLMRCRMVGASLDESLAVQMTRPPSAVRPFPGPQIPCLQTLTRVMPLPSNLAIMPPPSASTACQPPLAKRNDQVPMTFVTTNTSRCDNLKNSGLPDLPATDIARPRHKSYLEQCEYGPECQLCYDVQQDQQVKMGRAERTKAKIDMFQDKFSNRLPLSPLSAESEPAWLQVQHDGWSSDSGEGARVQLSLFSSLPFDKECDMSSSRSKQGNQVEQIPGIPSLNRPVASAPSFSAGSVGHPLACGGACKYQKTQRGCKLGAACNRCHLCYWTRASERELNSRKQVVSAGSVGHPMWCGGVCKAYSKRACKDGADCKRCHLCCWVPG